MPDRPEEKSEKIELEDLLRLKREERPSEQVWTRFDRELHQRMLQTLMKKDPWYVQALRGATGRIAQGTALASAAAVLALLVLRTSVVTQPGVAANLAANDAEGVALEAVAEIAVVELSPASLTERDYGVEVFTARDVRDNEGYERDFGMDRIEVAAFDGVSFADESALARTAFANTSVASLVF